MPDSKVLGVTRSLVYFDSLPIIATQYALEGFKKINSLFTQFLVLFLVKLKWKML